MSDGNLIITEELLPYSWIPCCSSWRRAQRPMLWTVWQPTPRSRDARRSSPAHRSSPRSSRPIGPGNDKSPVRAARTGKIDRRVSNDDPRWPACPAPDRRTGVHRNLYRASVPPDSVPVPHLSNEALNPLTLCVKESFQAGLLPCTQFMHSRDEYTASAIVDHREDPRRVHLPDDAEVAPAQR